MALNFYNVTGLNGETLTPREADVDAGAAATIETGMSITKAASQYVAESSTGATSASLIWGIAAGPSDETASVDGTVLYYRAPVLRATCAATTPGNLTAANKYTLVTLDVTGTTHTVDENDTTNGFITILDYDDTTNGNCIVEYPCRFILWT